jgi:hypothetical protein
MAFRKASRRFQKDMHERSQPAHRKKFGMLEKHKVRGRNILFLSFFFSFFPPDLFTQPGPYLVGLCETSA